MAVWNIPGLHRIAEGVPNGENLPTADADLASGPVYRGPGARRRDRNNYTFEFTRSILRSIVPASTDLFGRALTS